MVKVHNFVYRFPALCAVAPVRKKIMWSFCSYKVCMKILFINRLLNVSLLFSLAVYLFIVEVYISE